MIYKFRTDFKSSDVIMEIEKEGNEVSITLDSESSENSICILLSKEKLYDLIGSLHSIQGKLQTLEKGNFTTLTGTPKKGGQDGAR